MVALLRVHGAWQRLTPVAGRRDEKSAGERTEVVPSRICGQGVDPGPDAAGGIDLAETAADAPEIAQFLGLQDAALREAFRNSAEELRLFNDVLRPQLPLAQPGELIAGVGREEGHEAQRQGAQVHVAQMVHTERIAPCCAPVFAGRKAANEAFSPSTADVEHPPPSPD